MQELKQCYQRVSHILPSCFTILTLQDIILNLVASWSQDGCCISRLTSLLQARRKNKCKYLKSEGPSIREVLPFYIESDAVCSSFCLQLIGQNGVTVLVEKMESEKSNIFSWVNCNCYLISNQRLCSEEGKEMVIE